MFGDKLVTGPENLQAAPPPISDTHPAPNPIEPVQVKSHEIRSQSASQATRRVYEQVLTNAMLLGDILKTLKNMPEIEAAGLESVNDAIGRGLLTREEAILRLKDRVRETVYLSLEKNQAVG